MIHSIDALTPPAQGLVTVTYTSARGGEAQTQEASVPQFAAVLNRPGLHRRGRPAVRWAVHPLRRTDACRRLRASHRLFARDHRGSSGGLLEVYLSTRVLRCGCGCGCGFQMELFR
jgi:hypothetical protein